MGKMGKRVARRLERTPHIPKECLVPRQKEGICGPPTRRRVRGEGYSRGKVRGGVTKVTSLSRNGKDGEKSRPAVGKNPTYPKRMSSPTTKRRDLWATD